jgi:hypothetical protein
MPRAGSPRDGNSVPGGGPTGATRTFNGGQSFAQAQLLISLRFECPDGSFDVLVRVTLDFASGDTVGTWSVLRGTGAYVSLHGATHLSDRRLFAGSNSCR